jgi:hypothetical protein
VKIGSNGGCNPILSRYHSACGTFVRTPCIHNYHFPFPIISFFSTMDFVRLVCVFPIHNFSKSKNPSLHRIHDSKPPSLAIALPVVASPHRISLLRAIARRCRRRHSLALFAARLWVFAFAESKAAALGGAREIDGGRGSCCRS